MSISENTIITEYHITKADIVRGFEEGKLTKCSWRSFHGSEYRLLDASEARKFAETCPKDPTLVAAAERAALREKIVSGREELEKVTNDLDGIDERKATLIKRKQELETFLAANAHVKIPKKRKL